MLLEVRAQGAQLVVKINRLQLQQDPRDLQGLLVVQVLLVIQALQEIPVLLVIQAAPDLQVRQLRCFVIRFPGVQEVQEEMQALGAQEEVQVTAVQAGQAAQAAPGAMGAMQEATVEARYQWVGQGDGLGKRAHQTTTYKDTILPILDLAAGETGVPVLVIMAPVVAVVQDRVTQVILELEITMVGTGVQGAPATVAMAEVKAMVHQHVHFGYQLAEI